MKHACAYHKQQGGQKTKLEHKRPLKLYGQLCSVYTVLRDCLTVFYVTYRQLFSDSSNQYSSDSIHHTQTAGNIHQGSAVHTENTSEHCRLYHNQVSDLFNNNMNKPISQLHRDKHVKLHYDAFEKHKSLPCQRDGMLQIMYTDQSDCLCLISQQPATPLWSIKIDSWCHKHLVCMCK